MFLSFSNVLTFDLFITKSKSLNIKTKTIKTLDSHINYFLLGYNKIVILELLLFSPLLIYHFYNYYYFFVFYFIIPLFFVTRNQQKQSNSFYTYFILPPFLPLDEFPTSLLFPLFSFLSKKERKKRREGRKMREFLLITG
jgi:hypothetical protein